MSRGSLPLLLRTTPFIFQTRPTTSTSLQFQRHESQATEPPKTNTTPEKPDRALPEASRETPPGGPPEAQQEGCAEVAHGNASPEFTSGFRRWLPFVERWQYPEKGFIFDTRTGAFNRQFLPQSFLLPNMTVPPKPFDRPYVLKFLAQARAAFFKHRGMKNKNSMMKHRRGTGKMVTERVMSLLTNPQFESPGSLAPVFYRLVRRGREWGSPIPEHETHHLTPVDVFKFAIGNKGSDIQVYLDTQDSPSDDGFLVRRLSAVWVTVNAEFTNEKLLAPCGVDTGATVEEQLGATSRVFLESVLFESCRFLRHAWRDIRKPYNIAAEPVGGGGGEARRGGGGETSCERGVHSISVFAPQPDDCFPVVFAFHEYYMWFVFHGGPDAGVLAFHMAGTWLPEGDENTLASSKERRMKREAARVEIKHAALAASQGPEIGDQPDYVPARRQKVPWMGPGKRKRLVDFSPPGGRMWGDRPELRGPLEGEVDSEAPEMVEDRLEAAARNSRIAPTTSPKWGSKHPW